MKKYRLWIVKKIRPFRPALLLEETFHKIGGVAVRYNGKTTFI